MKNLPFQPLKLLYCLVMVSCIACLTGCSQPTDDTLYDAPSTPTDTVTPANYVISAQARLAEAEDHTWQDTVEAHPGDRIEIQIEYANYDTIKHSNVSLFVTIAEGLTYVEGSTRIFNAEHTEGYIPERDSLALGEGIVLGDYNGYSPADTHTDSQPASNAFARFTTTVDDTDKDVLLITRFLAQATSEESKTPTIRESLITVTALTNNSTGSDTAASTPSDSTSINADSDSSSDSDASTPAIPDAAIPNAIPKVNPPE